MPWVRHVITLRKTTSSNNLLCSAFAHDRTLPTGSHAIYITVPCPISALQLCFRSLNSVSIIFPASESLAKNQEQFELTAEQQVRAPVQPAADRVLCAMFVRFYRNELLLQTEGF
jgi:hypothetical protein